MMESMMERCRRICGNIGEQCFIGNKKQLSCISDMVINKVSGIKAIIEKTIEENQDEEMAELLNRASRDTDELINWIKFLQIAQDLRQLSLLQYDAGNVSEQRRENRYPFPEIYQKFISMKIKDSDSFVPVLLIDFSRQGLRFKSPKRFEADSVLECTLSTARLLTKEVFFKLRVRYSIEQEGGFVSGAQIEEVTDDVSFNFFNKVYDFIVGMLTIEFKSDT